MDGFSKVPPAVGLYDPRQEHDSCGVGLVARLDNRPRHEVVELAIEALENLDHRGATGADALTGDGAGILMQMPDRLLREEVDFPLPPLGSYGVLVCFLPTDRQACAERMALLERIVEEEGQTVLGWRAVPVRPEHTGKVAGACRPQIMQLFVAASPQLAEAIQSGKRPANWWELEGDNDPQDRFERKLYVIRRRAELYCQEQGLDDLYISSSSSRTINYKGMLISWQLPRFYPDLEDSRTETAVALVHSRFSTNTFPSWPLAHPYRVICHNGEINTLMGNINWMRARYSELQSSLFGSDLAKVLPLIKPGNSDSATFDNALELLYLSGRSLPHAVLMMVPEAYKGREGLSPDLEGFYDYHSCLMEPWDGPAVVAFTDGRVAGATLDRNGLRPGRWVLTKDGLVVLGSEAGLLELPPGRIERLGRLAPGRIFLIDLLAGRLVGDGEVKERLSTRRPYRRWFQQGAVPLAELAGGLDGRLGRPEDLHGRQLAFGYSQEDLRVLIEPMARNGEEPVGSMGNDLALAMLSDKAPPLFSYFKQLFAQVTNPPIDPIREEVVMSLRTLLGGQHNLLEEGEGHARQIVLERPLLDNDQLETLRQLTDGPFRSRTLDITWPVEEGEEGMERALERLHGEADQAIAEGINLLILSDRQAGPKRVPIPSLLAVSSVHHHLVREGTRLRCSLILESGEPREVHHFATLIGYGASAINPYLMLETLERLVSEGRIPKRKAPVTASGASGSNGHLGEETLDLAQAKANLFKAIDKGLLKTISKMGISTIQSYCGAQIFEAVGLAKEVVDRHFTGTASRVGGVDLKVLAKEALARHRRAYPQTPADLVETRSPSGGSYRKLLPVGGVYAWRRDGERHIWNPETVALVQHAVRSAGKEVEAALKGDGQALDQVRSSPAFATYKEYARKVNEEATRGATLRGLMRFRTEAVEPIPLEEVEPASEIVKRFCTGAMSLGSISREAHETLAIAMNRLGGRSNTGEGGEDPVRFLPDPNGDSRRSAIKQVASGRFGVTIHYLVNADELQIKMAQGAKPGEGGQLPGHKVDAYIGSIRHTTPGVGLISPPPHHDIYSIEDLKQLIYDLRCSNPRAEVSVKLVAEVGVGTIAAGVSKANADRVLISGHDGGTGASPLSSIQAAGVPWEIGLAETQQTLLLNDLRSRIVVQTDGQLKTGRDVMIAALLGADEMGFSTAPLIATGCIMMRACHLNTCPVGIATQDPELRKRFAGTPEHVVNFFFFVAEEVRELLASLGLRSLSEAIGRVDLLDLDPAIDHWKAKGVDLSQILRPIELPAGAPRRRVEPPPPVLEDHLDWQLLEQAKELLEGPAQPGEQPRQLRLRMGIRNVHRCVGGILSSEITRRFGVSGLPPERSLEVVFEGSAGQSFGGWLAPGVTFILYGDANDYTGKGLSGGVVAVRPREGMDPSFRAQEQVIVGNTVLYGATAGKAFFRGQAGERFAVRNSGAWAVVEGVGDHGCEYMTGGRVVVLGETGRNFAAGMSGGVAYVLDEHGRFPARCNMGMVGFEELSATDVLELRTMIEEHLHYTGSPVAADVLARFDDLLAAGAFVKVMPHDYKRVLEEEKRARETAELAGVSSEGEDRPSPAAGRA